MARPRSCAVAPTIAYCGYCGQPLVTKTYSNKRTKADGTTVHDRYEGYMCRYHKRGAKSQCTASKGYWRKDAVEDAVLTLVDQWFGQFDFEQVKAKVAESYRETTGQVQGSLETAKAEVEALAAKRAYYTEQLVQVYSLTVSLLIACRSFVR